MARAPSSGGLRPTRAGWTVCALVAILLPAALVLSYPELWVGTFTLIAALVLAAGSVLRPGSLSLERAVPAAVTNGDSVEQVVLVANRGRASGLLSLRDRVAEPMDPGGRPTDPVRLSPLGAGERRRLRTVVHTSARGVLGLGPARLTRLDPFGLFERPLPAGAAASVLVRPKTHRLVGLPGGGRLHDRQHAQLMTPTQAAEDFVGLRPYQAGDDIRHVHWPAVARSGNLMVRQFERPDESHVAIVLDGRTARHTVSTFERAVEAAASVAQAVLAERPARLLGTDGFDSGPMSNEAALGPLLNRLATVTMGTEANLASVARTLAGDASGLIVFCGTTLSAGDRDLIVGGDPTRTLVLVDCSATEARPRVVPFGPSQSLETSWAEAWRHLDRPGQRGTGALR
ncbi:MAG: DUF58 domain-containing protein [Microthrixaceae bacterium]